MDRALNADNMFRYVALPCADRVSPGLYFRGAFHRGQTRSSSKSKDSGKILNRKLQALALTWNLSTFTTLIAHVKPVNEIHFL